MAFALLAWPTARADGVLAGGQPQAPKVSAFGRALAWSTFDRSVNGWRLVVRIGGVTEMLPIAPRANPFDVDLGDDGHGGLVATYSRCSAPMHGLDLPHGCHLYLYDFADTHERPIAVANRAGRSQFDPSMAAGKVAFVQIGDGRTVGRQNQPRIYVQSLSGGKPKVLPGGIENYDLQTGPTALDLSSTALAFSWAMRGPGGTGEGLDYGDTELRVDRLSGGQTVVDVKTGGNLVGLSDFSPTLVSGAVYYGESATGDTTAYAFRALGLSDARAGLASAPLGMASVSTGSSATIYSSCPSHSFAPGGPIAQSCEVAFIGTVHYADPDRELADVGRPTTLSAAPQPENWMAWSAYDARARAYSLVLRRPDGSIFAAPVSRRRVPFDVELGPRRGGGVVAVYSRCRVEPRLDPSDRLPLPATGRGCRLYRYDVGSARERRIPGSGSRFLPSVWNDELAFATLGANGGARLYLGSLDGRSAPRRLPAGPSRGDAALGPRAVVLRGSQVAFVWERRTRSGLRSEVRLVRLGGRPGLLDAVTSRNEMARELSPFFAGGVLAWARRDAGARSQLKVFGLAKHRTSTYLVPGPIQAVAAKRLKIFPNGTSGTLLYARDGGGGGATIRLMSDRYFPAVRR